MTAVVASTMARSMNWPWPVLRLCIRAANTAMAAYRPLKMSAMGAPASAKLSCVSATGSPLAGWRRRCSQARSSGAAFMSVGNTRCELPTKVVMPRPAAQSRTWAWSWARPVG